MALTAESVPTADLAAAPRATEAAARAASHPRFSLVLATYGRSDVLAPMLASLIGQTCRDFELVVVDQNPDERVKPMLVPVREAGIAVSHLKAEAPNLSAARNLGIQQASGEWVAFPDDDCWYEPECLAMVADAIDRSPQADGWVADWVEVATASGGQKRSRPFEAEVFRAFRGGDASSITLFLRLATVRLIQGFDPRIGVGRYYGAGEETDLMIRLLDQGAVIQPLPEARVHHHHSSARPLASRAVLDSVRRRERGVGALYAKHRLHPAVIARGLLAPVVRGVAGPRPVQGLLFAWATIAGRVAGMARWRLHEKGVPSVAGSGASPVPAGVAPPEAGGGLGSQGEKMLNSERSSGQGSGKQHGR